MITDGILSALNMINEQLSTPEAKQAGEDIWNMLADFDEDEWEEMSVDECEGWIKSYVNEPKSTRKATTQELKRIIVDLRMDLVKETVPKGYCPYSYYSSVTQPVNCDYIDCDECRTLFFEKMEENIREEVEQL